MSKSSSRQSWPKNPAKRRAYKDRRNKRRAERRREQGGVPSMARHWRAYPQGYSDILLAFKQNGTYSLQCTDRREALNARSDFYRFREAVAAAIKVPDEYDPVLMDLIDAFNELVISAEAIPGTAPTRYNLHFRQNPVVANVATEPLDSFIQAVAAAFKISVPRASEGTANLKATGWHFTLQEGDKP